MEDYAYILDYLPQGLPGDRGYKREPLAYAIGDSEFKLFELVPKEDAIIQIGDKVYIGKEIENRKKIQHVKRRIGYEELTSAATSELPYIIKDIVLDSEERFVKFYNQAQAITTRYHMLELLPGLGKKTMWAIIEERKKGDFESFEDIGNRISSIKHPEKLIVKRIETELSDKSQKYHLFVAK